MYRVYDRLNMNPFPNAYATPEDAVTEARECNARFCNSPDATRFEVRLDGGTPADEDTAVTETYATVTRPVGITGLKPGSRIVVRAGETVRLEGSSWGTGPTTEVAISDPWVPGSYATVTLDALVDARATYAR